MYDPGIHSAVFVGSGAVTANRRRSLAASPGAIRATMVTGVVTMATTSRAAGVAAAVATVAAAVVVAVVIRWSLAVSTRPSMNGYMNLAAVNFIQRPYVVTELR